MSLKEMEKDIPERVDFGAKGFSYVIQKNVSAKGKMKVTRRGTCQISRQKVSLDAYRLPIIFL